MKNRLFLPLILILCSLTATAQKQYLIAGSGSQNIAIYDKDSESIVWSYKLGSGDECNCAIYLKGGDVAFSYSGGVRLVDKNGTTIFDYRVESGQQAQSISKIKGGYLVGVCGSPAQIIELSGKGEPIKTIEYDTKIDDVHSQFRQIRKSSNNTYLIPLMGGGKIVELDGDGSVVCEAEVEGTPFGVTQTKNGDWLSSCGHLGVIYRVDCSSMKAESVVSNSSLPKDAQIEFGAEVVVLKNNNLLLANWLGHNGDASQPILMEIDSEGSVVWKLSALSEISLVSTVFPIY